MSTRPTYSEAQAARRRGWRKLPAEIRAEIRRDLQPVNGRHRYGQVKLWAGRLEVSRATIRRIAAEPEMEQLLLPECSARA